MSDLGKNNHRIKVLLVDDHPIVTLGTRMLLTSLPNIEVVGEAGNGRDALALARQHQPHVALVDLKLRDENGIDLAKRIQKELPQTKIIVLTAYDAEPYVRAALSMGIKGYLLKDCSANEIENAIRTVYRGGTVFASDVAKRVIGGYLDSTSDQRRLHELTPREKEIVDLISRGKSNAEIGHLIGLSLRTVEAHVSSILGKLGARNRSEAIGIALRRGLVVLESGESGEPSR